MAVTAAITLSSATSKPGRPVLATCTVSNSGGVAVNVTSITPTAPPTTTRLNSDCISLGMPNFGPGMTTSVAAGGSTAFRFAVTPQTPTSGYGLAEAASEVYDIGAVIYTNESASPVEATTTTLTVTPPTL